ncbi:MAG: response regulator [Deltaproteobacteria bacterium]|nr:response regulator [Myxococcales bacterium]MDP3221480.1 response regulator [Deltaproteobacteria bacterium]
MNTDGRVLIIDDERDIIDTYREILADDGYESEAAMTAPLALAALKATDWAVVLLDQRLRGSSDGNSGLDLLDQIRTRAPFAKVIVVTGFADPVSVQRAFDRGAWDYLQKDSLLTPLLRVKVRNAMELWRERMLGALSKDKREEEIASTWKQAQAEGNPQAKGKLLETLMLLIFRSVPGFERSEVNVQNDLEEIDVVVQNGSTDPVWQKEGTYLLAECKNRSTVVGVDALKLFRMKIEDRYGRASMGFFIAPGGYASTVNIEEWTRRSGKSLVVLLDRADIDVLVASTDRNATLKAFHHRAVIAGHG